MPTIKSVVDRKSRYRIYTAIKQATRQIAEDINNYIIELIRENNPELLQKVSRLDTEGIADVVAYHLRLFVRRDGLSITLSMDDATNMMIEIINMIRNNPRLIRYTEEFFERIVFDRSTIYDIVTTNISQVFI